MLDLFHPQRPTISTVIYCKVLGGCNIYCKVIELKRTLHVDLSLSPDLVKKGRAARHVGDVRAPILHQSKLWYCISIACAENVSDRQSTSIKTLHYRSA